MAQNTTTTLAAKTWTQLTNANVTAITFQNLGSSVLKVKGTNGANAPSDDTGSISYSKFQGERNVALTDLFPGVSGVNRVYVYSAEGGNVAVSHA